MPGPIIDILTPLSGATTTNPVIVTGTYVPDPARSALIYIVAKDANGTPLPSGPVLATTNPLDNTFTATMPVLTAGKWSFTGTIGTQLPYTVDNVTVQ